MNREILFKAKTTKKNDLKHEFNEKWVEGNLILCGDKAYIHPVSNKIDVTGEIGRIIVMHEVDPDTICQYTGLIDKNGKRIWENDILVEKHKGIVTMKYRVVFDLEEGAWMLETKSGARYGIGAVNQRHFEVCGNIFDNADLLEVD